MDSHLGPAAPDMYPYCFIVDGVSIMDPLCDQYFPNEGFKNSLLDIASRQGPMVHDVTDVPHGRVEYVHYYSKSLGATNNAVVYLPPSYAMSRDRHYPVFYLISGTTDTEEVYYKVGRVNYIMDNLVAQGAAQEMIIVLPYGNPFLLSPAPREGGGMPQLQFGGDVFSRDLNEDLMPYIDSNYRTLADRDHRAIGGFSRGGNQALFNGLSHLDKFSYLCSYSSFTSTDIPNVYDNAGRDQQQDSPVLARRGNRRLPLWQCPRLHGVPRQEGHPLCQGVHKRQVRTHLDECQVFPRPFIAAAVQARCCRSCHEGGETCSRCHRQGAAVHRSQELWRDFSPAPSSRQNSPTMPLPSASRHPKPSRSCCLPNCLTNRW